MTPRPDLGSVADELYAKLEPFHQRIHQSGGGRVSTDEDLGWPLYIVFGGIASFWQEVDDLSRDSDDGVGWSTLLDIDRIPDKGLPYLAQFKGKTLLPGMTPDVARERIRSSDGFERGTPDAISVAAKRHLTGARTAYVRERFDGTIWSIRVVTYVDETPDPEQTFRDMLEQKPYGYVLDHSVQDAWNYEVLRVAFNDYGEIAVHYADYQGVADNDPPA